MNLVTFALFTFLAVPVWCSSQHPFIDVPTLSSYEGVLSLVGDLSALSEETFSTLRHPTFPQHSVRIKKTKFCDGTVQAFTGYIDIGPRHLFFYFFESRREPSKDDVILWTNGGPGCSSAIGLFMELGPCRIGPKGTQWHAQSWNEHANIFFIDQPVGVGFSYADHGAVSTTDEAAEDIAGFVALFFEHFSQFQGRRLHLAGESYAGRYLPVFASYILDQNEGLKEKGMAPINLQSVMIGNGGTYFPAATESYYDMACTKAGPVGPILGIKACVRMKQAQIRCDKWLQKSCLDSTFDPMACQAAATFCDRELSGPVVEAGWNPYDISRKCDGTLEETLCYPIMRNVSAYLDRPDVRETIGVDPYFESRPFESCNMKVNGAFIGAMDDYHTSHHYVAELLERRVKVLLYVGKNDLGRSGFIANRKWATELEWSGKTEFGMAKTRDWFVSEESAQRSGTVKSYGGLTFLIVERAGHMVPFDRPEEALWILRSWLTGYL